MDLKTLLDIPPWDWPTDAGKTFERVLTDRQASKSDRLAAAELAGDLVVMNDALADALMTVLRNAGETEALRAKAAISFGAVLEQSEIDEFEDPDDMPIQESTFNRIRHLLHDLYIDKSVPKQVRRRILEASVRASAEWHSDAIRDAYSSGDPEWMLTAVFAMRWVDGFDAQILEALRNTDPEIHYEAVKAAGRWELDAAWPHIVELATNPNTPKPLLLAGIDALAAIRPQQAGLILVDLTDSEDPEIVDAAHEAMTMAEVASDDDEDDEDEDDEDEQDSEKWVN